MQYFIELLKQTSTWRGLVMIITALGVALNPDQQSAIISSGLAVAGAIGAFFPDDIGSR